MEMHLKWKVSGLYSNAFIIFPINFQNKLGGGGGTEKSRIELFEDWVI